MTNWINIHPNFTGELSEEWLSYCFTYEQVRDWINIGLTPEDAGFANYLWEKEYTPEEVLNYGDLMELRENYENNIAEKGKGSNTIQYYFDENEEIAKEIMMINRLSDFERDLASRERWWNQGFNYEKAQEWIRAGLEFNEQGLATYIVREKGYSYPSGIPNDVLSDLRNEYQETDEYQISLAIALSLEKNGEEIKTQIEQIQLTRN